MNINPRVAVMREAISKVVEMLSNRKIRVTQEGTRAYVAHDTRTHLPIRVNIPYLPDDAGDELLDATQGFLDHEVGHLLFSHFPTLTDVALKRDKGFKSLVNIIEDTFIERKMTQRFQGSGSNLTSVLTFVLKKIIDPRMAKATTDDERLRLLIMPLCRALAGQAGARDYIAPHMGLLAATFIKLGPDFPGLMQGIDHTTDTVRVADEFMKRLGTPMQRPEEGASGSETCEGEPGEEGSAPGDKGEPQEGKPEPDDKPEETGEPDDGEGDGEGKGTASEDAEGEEPCAGEGEGEGEGAGDPEDESEGGGGEGDGEEEAEGEPGAKGKEKPKGDKPEKKGKTKSDSKKPTPKGKEKEDAGDAPAEGEKKAGDGAEGEEGEDAAGSAGADEKGDTGAGDNDPDANPHEHEQNNEPDPEDRDEIQQNDSHHKEKFQGAPGDAYAGVIEEVDTSADRMKDAITGNDEDFDDMAGEAIVHDSIIAIRGSDYKLWSKDYDVLETIEVPENFTLDKNCMDCMRKMTESVDHMVGPMQKDLERAIAAKSLAVYTGGHRSGKLHGASLARVIMNRDDVFRRKHVNRTKDVAVSLVVDGSGSMASKIDTAAYAAYALSSILDRLNIVNECISFTTRGFPAAAAARMKEDLAKLHPGELYARHMALYTAVIKEFSEKLNPRVRERFVSLGHFFEEGLQANVDGESVQLAYLRLMKRREARKVMIVLSDGHPACPGDQRVLGPHLKAVVDSIQKSGVDVVGIGIQDASVQKFYPKSVVLNNIADLPGTVMQQLRKLLMPA